MDVLEHDESPPRKPAFQGITTVDALQELDEKALVRGYLAGLKANCDFTETDPGYMHGYLNGMVDGGHAEATPAQHQMARAYVAAGALKADVQRWKSEPLPA